VTKSLAFSPLFSKFPVNFPVSREFRAETGSPLTGSSASYYVFDIASVFVFPGRLFSREFAGSIGLEFKAICGRDGCTRDFGCGRYENLSGALSWLTLLAGRAADVRRSQSVWRRKLAESTMSFAAKAEELSLFSPAGRQQRQAHDVMPDVGLHRCLFCATDQAASATVQRDAEIDFGSCFAIIADR
jgi:hypothetical protein